MKHEIFNYDGHTGDIIFLAEEAGLIKKQCRPEECSCPECGERAVYTWRHIAHGDICMAAECSCCDFNILTTGVPVKHIQKLLEKIKERSFNCDTQTT